MSITRRMLMVLPIVAFPVSWGLAQDKPAGQAPSVAESLETVTKEYNTAHRAWSKEERAAHDEAGKNGKEKDFRFDKPMPDARFAPRFLAIAERNPEGPNAIEALRYALWCSYGPRVGTSLESWGKALKVLEDYHVAKPSIKGLLRMLTSFDDEDSRALVADVIARNPDRKIQAAAYRGMVAYREWLCRFADDASDPGRLDAFEKLHGRDFVKKRLAQAAKARVELVGLKKTIHEKYSDLINDLSIGNAAPEIAIQTLDGKKASLLALKGKVVVLDFWATWCGYCKEMIPHEREMVERLKDKPFALVSISVDEKKVTLTDFLGKEKMPWTHWWNGSEGGVIDDWDVRYYPTIYVLDTQGVIRHKDLRGEDLEKAVNALLAEKPKA